MVVIEQYKPELKGILPQDEYLRMVRRPENWKILEQLLRIFADIPKDASDDLFSHIYVYFLSKFALAEGQVGGEFYTSLSVIRLMVEIVEPLDGIVFDPACGSGGMLIQAAQFIKSRKEPQKNNGNNNFFLYGQEKIFETLKLAKMNLAINGLHGDIQQVNTFYEDPFQCFEKFNYVFCNPPLNVDEVSLLKVEKDQRFNSYGIPYNKSGNKRSAGIVPNANYLWINLFATSLKKNGRAGFVMANSASDARYSEAEIRKNLIEKNLIYAMILLPSNMFYTMKISATLWFLDKGKYNNKILFIDARNVFTQVDRSHREFSKDQIQDLAMIARIQRGQRGEFVRLIHHYVAQIMEKLQSNKEMLQIVTKLLEQILVESKEQSILDLSEQLDNIIDLEREYTEYHSKVDFMNIDTANLLQRELSQVFLPFFSRFQEKIKETEKSIGHIEKELSNNKKFKQAKSKVGQLFEILKNAEYYYEHIQWLQERFPDANYEDIVGLCKLVSLDEVREQEYSLNPGRYVGMDYQEQAILAVEKAISQGRNKILVSMAPRTGKFFTIASLIVRLIKHNHIRILLLADRREMLDQFTDTIRRISDVKYPIRIVDKQTLLSSEKTFIACATVQKLFNILFKPYPKGFDLGVEDIYRNSIDLIIVGECYSFTDSDNNSWVKALDYFDATKVGFTSYPYEKIRTVFKDLVYSYSNEQATLDKYSNSIADSNLDYIKSVYERVEEQSNRSIPRTQQLEELIEAYRNEKLVLVLGAGVSYSCGLPDWNTLLQNLLIKTLETGTQESKDQSEDVAGLFSMVFPSSPLIAARNLGKLYQDKHKNDLKMGFESFIRKILYEDKDSEKDSPLIHEIIQLCIAPGKTPNLDSIITFNFDDLLEYNLKHLEIEIPYKSIYSIGMTPSLGELPIYHVHGFLPREGELTEKNQITLKEDMYHHQYNDIYSWNNIVQLNKYCDYTCLFIGISFTDPNLRRLLDIAMLQRGGRSAHYMFRKKYDTKEIENNFLKKINKAKKIEKDDMINISDLSEKADYLAKMMQKFDDNDAASFGVSIIWVDDFEEVPLILRDLKKGRIKR